MFYGRKQELQDLRELQQSRVASFVVLKGRRRIGKSTLVFEYAKSFEEFYHFAGLPPSEDMSQDNQKSEFAKRLERYLQVKGLEASNWSTLFENLGQLASKGEALVFIDEIAWMAKGDPTFLPKLKTAWDLVFKQNPKLVLIVCSSVSSWVDKNLLSSTGFVGRVTLEKQIGPLPLNDCLEFWPDRISADEKLEFLTSTGCIPRYLEELQPNLPAEANIRRLFFREDGLLFNEFDRIFSDLFSTKVDRHRKIVENLSLGHKSQTQLAQQLPEFSSNEISKLVSELEAAGFIKRDFTWNIGKSTNSKLSKYRVSDNYIRFYMRLVQKNHRQISEGLLREVNLHELPGWYSSVGHGFENLVLENRQLIRESLGIKPHQVRNDGPYFQPATKRQAGCQIDYMIETDSNNLYLCEIKYSSKSISDDVINQVEQQLKNIKIPKRTSVRTVLIHFGEVSDKTRDSGIFNKIIDFSDFLKPT